MVSVIAMVKAIALIYWLNGCVRLSANSFCTPPDLLAHKMLTFQWSVVPDEKGVFLCEALTCTAT